MDTLLDYKFRIDPIWQHTQNSKALSHLSLLFDMPISFPGDSWLDDIPIQQLTGGPLYIGDRYSISDTQITSLRGSPLVIHGSFFCCNVNITSLEGMPLYIGKHFYCRATINGKTYTEETMREYLTQIGSTVQGNIILLVYNL